MKIAVLIGGMGFDSQQRVINGILNKAIPDGTNVFIFTGDGWDYMLRSKYEEGEYSIYELPDFTEYDGIIFNSYSIHNLKTVAMLEEQIRASKVPCVSLNHYFPEFLNIMLDSKKGMEKIVEHLIRVHGAKNIYFIAGPKGNKEADKRLEVYKTVMEANGLAWSGKHIYYGDYCYESGRQAAACFLQDGGGKPDAVIAANDAMAIGAALVLKKAGYCIPEDIIVTGYDNSEIAACSVPRLTSVRRREFDAGEMAYEKVKAAVNGEVTEQCTCIESEPIFSGSCGCRTGDEIGSEELRENYIVYNVDTDRSLEIIKSSSADFTALADFDSFLECLEGYVRRMGPDYFYLCLCGNPESYYHESEALTEGEERSRDTAHYSDNIWIPFAYEKGKRSSYGEFHKGMLLPPDCRMQKEGAFYTVMPLHFRDYCFGYCITGNFRPALKGMFFQNFVLNLDNALETIRKQEMMKAMVKRLDRLWILDELTGVYNRAGFRRYAQQLLEAAKEEKQSVSVIFADLDGLKKVNDLYGHEEGDILIKALSSVMEQTMRHDGVIGRFGGDEFVIFMKGYTEHEAENDIARIQAAISSYNALHEAPYELAASIGYYLEQNAEQTDLSRLIELADQMMYQVKRQRKALR